MLPPLPDEDPQQQQQQAGSRRSTRKLTWGGAVGAQLCDKACFRETVQVLEGWPLLGGEDSNGDEAATEQAASSSSSRRTRARGVILAVFSMLVTAPDGVLIYKLDAEIRGQTDAIVVLWKWLLVSLICGSAVLLQLCRARAADSAECERKGTQLRPFLAMGRSGWLHLGVGSFGIVIASLHTLGLIHSIPSIAIMLFYLNPLWSVLMDAFVLVRHQYTSAMKLCCITLIGSVLGHVSWECGTGLPCSKAHDSRARLRAASDRAASGSSCAERQPNHATAGGTNAVRLQIRVAKSQLSWYGFVVRCVHAMRDYRVKAPPVRSRTAVKMTAAAPSFRTIPSQRRCLALRCLSQLGWVTLDFSQPVAQLLSNARTYQ